jgi:hypothetical protein
MSPWIRFLGASAVLTSALLAQEPEAASKAQAAAAEAKARLSTILTNLGAQPATRYSCKTTNVWYDNLIKARGQGRAVNTKRFLLHGVSAGDLGFWWTELQQADPATVPERHVLARSGVHWVQCSPAGDWIKCQRPTAEWQATFLADPVFLARCLLERLPNTEWEEGAENVDERMVRVYRTLLGDTTVTELVRQGALPDSADTTTSLAQIGREYIGRTLRRTERQLEIKIYVDPKAKLPIRFFGSLYQAAGQTAGGFVFGGGAPGAPKPADPAKPNKGQDQEDDEKRQPYLTTEIVLQPLGDAKTAILDAKARELLGLK